MRRKEERRKKEGSKVMYMKDNARQMRTPKAASDFQREKTELPWAGFELCLVECSTN